MSARRMEYMPVEDLVPAPHNPKRHADDQIRGSMRRFGYTQPILVDERTGRMAAGHGRRDNLLALRDGGAAPPEGVVIDDQGRWCVPVIRGWASRNDDEAEEYVAADNRITEAGGWDEGAVADLLKRIDARGTWEGVGWTRDEALRFIRAVENPYKQTDQSGRLAEEFLVPPFSVLDTRQGYWQDRRRVWLSLGLRGELGRGEFSSPGGSPPDAATRGPDGKTVRGDGRGKPLGTLGAIPPNQGDILRRGRGEAAAAIKAQRRLDALQKNSDSSATGQGALGHLGVEQRGAEVGGRRLTYVAGARPAEALDDTSRRILEVSHTGTSIFDPVLCELAYRWFAPPGGSVLDPFAGGSVRGIVAAALGHPYVGVDLRSEQVAANRAQWDDIRAILHGDAQTAREPVVASPVTSAPSDLLAPKWVVGDSSNVLTKGGFTYDLLFSCPPYADLERYSDDPRDLSTMAYKDFLQAYYKIIRLAVGHLRPNRFAVWVVSEVRAPDGCCRQFVRATIDAFTAAGMSLYNEAVLVNAIGSLPLRAARPFRGNRKLGRTHQNVLVFYKGDPAAIAPEFGEVKIPDRLLALATGGTDGDVIPDEGGDHGA